MTPTLTISTVDADDVATYRCVVTGGCGSATSADAALSLNGATTITQQPAPQGVAAGATATFAVAATGEGTLSYQWQKAGADLIDGGHYAGATTDTLTVSTVDAADVAAYRCMVTAACGTATSDEAALTLAATATADFDLDGDVDLNDFAVFQGCFNGPNRPPAAGCQGDADFDSDQDVDLNDFAIFQGCFNGPNRPPAAGCL